MKKKATLPPLAHQCGLVQAEQTKKDSTRWLGQQKLVVTHSVYAYQSFPR